MKEISKLMCGVILLSVPTIDYGGFFLLTILSGKQANLELTGFQKAMFRAGHSHAGVLVILVLIAQFLADYANLSGGLIWFARIGFPFSIILVSGGFFWQKLQKTNSKKQRINNNKILNTKHHALISLTYSYLLAK